MVLVSLTIVVLSKLTGIVVLADTVVVTEVETVGQSFQRQLYFSVDIGKERVGAVIVVNKRTMIRILTRIMGRIINDVTLIVIRLCQWTALDEIRQIGLLTIAVLKRSEGLYTGLQPFHGLDIEVHADRVTLVVIVQQIVLLRGVA